MAANVETMFYVREKPWHGLGVEVQEALKSADALEMAGLNWEVVNEPVFNKDGNIVKGYQMNVRSTDRAVMGIVTNKYQIVQNKEAFEFTDSLVGEGITYETAGSLRKGKQIWLLGKMPDRYILGDKFEPYICFTNTHDGTGAVRACMTPIRVVCNNTLNLALSSAHRSWSTPHRGDISSRLDEARQTLEFADKYLEHLNEEADRLANEKMDEGQIVSVMNLLIPTPEDASTRQKRTIQKAKDDIMVCMLSHDLAQFVNTKWGLLNAVSDYVGHADPMRRTSRWEENRWGNIINGHVLMDRAMSLVK